jgi:hypothetical protein
MKFPEALNSKTNFRLLYQNSSLWLKKLQEIRLKETRVIQEQILYIYDCELQRQRRKNLHRRE